MEHLKEFRDQLLNVIERMDSVVSASVIEDTSNIVIGAELDDGETVFIAIQPA